MTDRAVPKEFDSERMKMYHIKKFERILLASNALRETGMAILAACVYEAATGGSPKVIIRRWLSDSTSHWSGWEDQPYDVIGENRPTDTYRIDVV